MSQLVFEERIKATMLRKSYLQILAVLLNIALKLSYIRSCFACVGLYEIN